MWDDMLVCPSVLLWFKYYGWNEMQFACLSYLDLNMRVGMKCSLSACLSYLDPRNKGWNETFSPCSPEIRGKTKRSLSVCMSYFDSDMRGEMKLSLSVCLTWIPFWGLTCNVVRIYFVYSLSVCMSYFDSDMRGAVCHTWIQIWGVKLNVVCPSVCLKVNVRRKMKHSLSVCLTWIPIWRMKWSLLVCLSLIPIWRGK